MISDRPATVLVVDDDSDVRASLELLMSALGYTVESFASGKEFLARAPWVGPQCLLLDLRMPGVTGLDVLQTLNERQCFVPTVMISGQADVQSAVGAMRKGAVDFLEKPYEGQALVEAVGRAVRLSAEFCDQTRQRASLEERYSTLTSEEREVMSMVIAGKSEADMVEKLDCSRRTVQLRRASLMSKMQAHNLPELVTFGMSLTQPV